MSQGAENHRSGNGSGGTPSLGRRDETKAGFRVVLLEANEISWTLMEPWLSRGELPHFTRLKSMGAWGRSRADEPKGLLDPWVTWTTVHTGVPQSEHGMVFLEQPPETLRAPRTWDYARAAGRSLGVFGASGTWPPVACKGFFIPGCFAPSAETHPPDLQVIQELNLRYTRAHAPGASDPGLLSMVTSGLQLLSHGLDVQAVLGVLRCLAETKVRPDRSWKKVSLQPELNFAFFKKLFATHRPDYSIFHTNHVAHYQHRFLRAHRPDLFPDPTDPREVEQFGDAIAYGYKTMDRLLGRFMQLADRDPDVVLCVASSMGQRPYIPDYAGYVAPPTCRIKSIERLVETIGLKGHCTFFSTMAPQWNLRIPDPARRAAAIEHLRAAEFQPIQRRMYEVVEVRDTLVVTPLSRHGMGSDTRCVFPTLPGAPVIPFDTLCIQEDETRKSGCHDPVGMLAFYGRAIRAGYDFGYVTNLQIAPTLLTLLGVPTPEIMKGRALAEIVLTPPSPHVASSAGERTRTPHAHDAQTSSDLPDSA